MRRARAFKNVTSVTKLATKAGYNQAGTTPVNSPVVSCVLLLSIFVSTIVVITAFSGSHLTLLLDEGIYLHGAQRVLLNQHPYADWFVFTGPLTFWALAGLFTLGGTSLVVAHGLLALELALIACSIYWIIAQHVNRLVGIAMVGGFLALLLNVFPHRLYMNHRWDSTCFSVLSIALLLSLQNEFGRYLVAGMFAGLSIAFTPTTVFIVVALLGAFMVTQSTKASLWFGLGVLLPLLLLGGVLAFQGAFLPMLRSFQWARQHYQHANSVPYGFEPTTLRGRSESFVHRFWLSVPAVLPLLTFLLLGLLLWKRIQLSMAAKMLTVAGVGAVLACYPRWAANQLLFALPIFLCLIAILSARALSQKTLRTASFYLLLISVVALVPTNAQHFSLPIETNLGSVQCTLHDQPSVAFATATVQAGETLFVYPYEPIWYSVTGGTNPTSYDFLQPGMMTADDESKALGELEARPPQWVIWHNLSPQTVLAYWPNSDWSTLRFPRIEQFIRTHYVQVRPPNPKNHYSIAVFHHT